MPKISPLPSSQPTSAIQSGPSQYEYDAAVNQIRERESSISQLQQQINDLNGQNASLSHQLREKENQLNQVSEQASNLNNILLEKDNQINSMVNEKSQLENQLRDAQNQSANFQEQLISLQQQFAPLQQQVTKLQGELTYREKRIKELQEPKAVMPSTLGQRPATPTYVSPSTPSIGQTPTIGTPSTPDASFSSGRRVCPNCGASGFAIKEVEDRTKIVSYIPKPIYAKKMICTKCSYEF
jgi:septal ring factor EnvC (AmiA/AmiB activator)